ncbi:hypothetical protein SHAM105786_03080 [Shewanella amazonensis]|uniref:Uncharacterized protein n=1 Tax=Shewanella amazonensis (strain ATCC BAA-1098 / SB2B) TaxID=326297 RepID=A1S521_SHEAM|nr:hypothetical protein [Shewanella amazonensis]ABL99477.1 conserved hypothetical protein [Shewanella amazonensis SB2B]
MAKVDKKLNKLCRKVARKALGLSKDAVKDKANKSDVKVFASRLRQQLAANGKLPDSNKAASDAGKFNKKAVAQQLKRLALSQTAKRSSANDDQLPQVRKLRPAVGSMAFALKPLKRKPCGGCPAKRGGLCACALKLAKRKAG